MALTRVALGCALALFAAAVAAQGEDPGGPHRTADGFRNPNGAQVVKPLGDLLRWKLDAWRAGLPPDPQQPTPMVRPALQLLQAKSPRPSATWIGHATVLVQSGGLNILTDPVFSERASPFGFLGPKRAQPPGIALADLPAIDVVLVSHNHYDHLDLPSVQALNERAQGRTVFLVPLGLKAWFAEAGIRNVVEMDWWEQRQVAGVDFVFLPAQHWSARTLTDRNQTLWGAWAVFAPDLRWYFSGDTGYSKLFAQSREKLSAHAQDGHLFDLALLAIGAYAPRWFMAPQHMNPAEAVQAHKDLAARHSIGIHWGTFELTDEALDQPPRDLASAREQQGMKEQDFNVLPVGGTWWADGPHAAAPKQ